MSNYLNSTKRIMISKGKSLYPNYQHRNFKTIFSFHQSNVLSLKSPDNATAYFTQEGALQRAIKTH